MDALEVIWREPEPIGTKMKKVHTEEEKAAISLLLQSVMQLDYIEAWEKESE